MSSEWGLANSYRYGKVHVLSEKCSTCIFRPGNLMTLRPGRVKELVEANLKEDAAVTCHQTLPLKDNAICRGYFDAYAEDVLPLRYAKMLGVIVEVSPPAKESDDHERPSSDEGAPPSSA